MRRFDISNSDWLLYCLAAISLFRPAVYALAPSSQRDLILNEFTGSNVFVYQYDLPGIARKPAENITCTVTAELSTGDEAFQTFVGAQEYDLDSGDITCLFVTAYE
ncbi:hypothetical protein HDU89_001065 [Geranomyces variabilis]|nr:hypothetical protein HDU89_001065 [Geranomyces variabilis]